MRYFKLSYSLDLDVVGFFPQITDTELTCHIDDPLFVSKFLWSKPPNQVIVPKGIMHYRAKITDLLSSATAGLSGSLLVSEKMKSILSDALYGKADFLKTTVIETNGSERTYFSVHAYKFQPEVLNFPDCIVFEAAYGFQKKQQVHISNLNEFEVWRQSLTSPSGPLIEKVSVRSDITEDAFFLRNVSSGQGIFVSENMRRQLTKANISGLIFEDL
jgi:hypothetical protein